MTHAYVRPFHTWFTGYNATVLGRKHHYVMGHQIKLPPDYVDNYELGHRAAVALHRENAR